jgi:hypothetical protein
MADENIGLTAELPTEVAESTGREHFYCDPTIEDCATDEIFKNAYAEYTAYAIIGSFVYFNLVTPIVGYLVRMSWRA